MKLLKGNLLDLAEAGEFDVIVHGCNCMNTMGAGIALQIAKRYPEAKRADQATVRGAYDKLGSYTYAVVRGSSGEQFTIVNAYTQYGFGGILPQVSYDAVRDVFSKIAADFPSSRIGIPKIGAGLGGGDWNILYDIISQALAYRDATVVVMGSKL